MTSFEDREKQKEIRSFGREKRNEGWNLKAGKEVFSLKVDGENGREKRY